MFLEQRRGSSRFSLGERAPRAVMEQGRDGSIGGSRGETIRSLAAQPTAH